METVETDHMDETMSVAVVITREADREVDREAIPIVMVTPATTDINTRIVDSQTRNLSFPSSLLSLCLLHFKLMLRRFDFSTYLICRGLSLAIRSKGGIGWRRFGNCGRVGFFRETVDV